MNSSSPNQKSSMANPLETMQPGEQIIFEIRRHPIGIITTFALVGFLIIAMAIVLFGVVPSSVDSSNKDQAMALGTAAFLFITVISLAFAFIANKVYWGNSWILTNDSITQIVQTGLFHKHSSQLSLENLEDVTTEQNGIMTHMFNYGILKAETAGERSKFSFTYCPNPNFYAQKVLQAREIFEQHGRYQAEHYERGRVPGSQQFTGSVGINNPETPSQNNQQQ